MASAGCSRGESRDSWAVAVTAAEQLGVVEFGSKSTRSVVVDKSGTGVRERWKCNRTCCCAGGRGFHEDVP